MGIAIQKRIHTVKIKNVQFVINFSRDFAIRWSIQGYVCVYVSGNKRYKSISVKLKTSANASRKHAYIILTPLNPSFIE